MRPERLMEYARQARENAYAPYSGFTVGAALLCDDGAVYQGCNIENAAYSPTLCAERVAFAKAVSQGQRDFAAIAICGGKGECADSPCPPCGVCRQVMAEFCRPELRVYLMTPEGIAVHTLAQLLPESFSLQEQV